MIYVVLVEVYAENLSHKDNGREKEKYLIFSDDCGYSPLIRHQYSTSSSWLKVSCNVDSETMWMSFSHSITLKSTGLSYTLNGSLTHEDFIRSYIDHSENTHSLSYTDLPNTDIFQYTISKNIYSEILPPTLSEKSFK